MPGRPTAAWGIVQDVAEAEIAEGAGQGGELHPGRRKCALQKGGLTPPTASHVATSARGLGHGLFSSSDRCK